MATTTTTYSFNTPTPGTEEDTWGTLVNDNMDDLDDLLDGTTQVECIRWDTAALASTALDPDSANIKTFTMSANTTFTDSLADGDWLVLHLDGGDSYTATWPTITWLTGGAPTLTASDAIGFYKVSTTLFGTYMGAR